MYDQIENAISTLQQENALEDYKAMCEESCMEPNCDHFQTWYGYWCVEQGRFNDINESNF